MKVSNTNPTHLLVKAYSDSEWALCDFALIELPTDWRTRYEEYLKTLETLTTYDSLSAAYFNGYYTDYFVYDEDKYPKISKLLGEYHWYPVILTAEEVAQFTQIEDRLELFRDIVYRNGDISYNAVSKYGNDVYYTENIRLEELLEHIKTDENE